MESSSSSCRLISVIDDGVARSDGDEASLIDAAFHIPGSTQLQLDVHEWGSKAAEYLDHAVARAPGDLRRHVQRINVLIHRNDADGVYGALLDLFIVLTDRGRPLRERMLHVSRKLLGEEKYGFLAQRLDAGIMATDAVPPYRTSLLSKGLSGTSQLVTRLDAREAPSQDPLDEAHDCLEYGQIDEARQVLEAAILKQPGRPEIHHDLLEIYKSTNAKGSFLAMRRRLDIEAGPLSEAWRELAAFFGEED